ncbi:MAG: ATP synthase subunit I [Gammaproteobacteria bacterium]|nr:ATP synthase subunit I [Gammaproteobacteria bacterium]NNC78143.1 F0F1 ATP synthase subunit I [Woeseiaceae bacterium]
MRLVIAIQVGLGAVIAAVLWGVFGQVSGYSALLGGLIAAVPNGFLALRLSLPRRDPGAQGLLRAAYIGELGKLALTVLLFSIVFVTVRPLAAVPLFATFIVTALVPLAGLLVRDEQQTQDTVDSDGE